MTYNNVGEKNMQKNALEILSKIENNGFEAYIVGGFVRDYCMNKKSLDVDICTNATPKELSTIFEGAVIPSETYGAVTLLYKQVRYEITTYRKEINYDDYRRPDSIEYVDNLLDDLKRRDFTVNTLCMNSKGKVIDLLNVEADLNQKLIKTVGDPNVRLQEDVLRILRAVRFATTLNFTISDDTKEAIIKHGKLLRNLSYTRKKEELTKIFTSTNASYGVSLLIELGLDKNLELSNLENLKLVDDILGIWAQLDVLDIYPFSKVEKETIIKVKEALILPNIDKYMLYKNGLYIMSIVASIKGIDKKSLNEMYSNLPIKSRNEIKLDVNELCTSLKIKPSYWLKDVYLALESAIIDGKILNEQSAIHQYVSHYLETILLVK
jgi:tRNA nucleotidyltransferase (CCA-adding enzyme)